MHDKKFNLKKFVNCLQNGPPLYLYNLLCRLCGADICDIQIPKGPRTQVLFPPLPLHHAARMCYHVLRDVRSLSRPLSSKLHRCQVVKTSWLLHHVHRTLHEVMQVKDN
jgi:hypothetical protein